MRRKSTRNAQKATPDKPVKEKESTPKTRRSRRRKRSPSKSSESEEEILTVTKRAPPDPEETPDTTTKSHTPSEEDASEEAVWKVTSADESPPKGEIQKLKICLTRPAPDSPEKVKTRRSKSNSQTEDDTTSSEDKSSRRTRSRGSPFVRNDGISSQEGDEDVEEKKGKGKSKGKHRSKIEKSPHLSEPELQTNNEISENVQVTPQSPSIDKPVDNAKDCKVDDNNIQNVNENVQGHENVNEESSTIVRESEKDQDTTINTTKHEADSEEVTESKDSDDDQPLSIIKKVETVNNKAINTEIETSETQNEVVSKEKLVEEEVISKEAEDEVSKERDEEVSKEKDEEVSKESSEEPSEERDQKASKGGEETSKVSDEEAPKERDEKVSIERDAAVSVESDEVATERGEEASKDSRDEIVSKDTEIESVSKVNQSEAVQNESQHEPELLVKQEEVQNNQKNLEESLEETVKLSDLQDQDQYENQKVSSEEEKRETSIQKTESSLKETNIEETKDESMDESTSKKESPLKETKNESLGESTSKKVSSLWEPDIEDAKNGSMNESKSKEVPSLREADIEEAKNESIGESTSKEVSSLRKADLEEAKNESMGESTSKNVPEVAPIQEAVNKEENNSTEDTEINKSDTSDTKIGPSKSSEENSSPKVDVEEKRKSVPRRERVPRRKLKRTISIQSESKEKEDITEPSSIKPSRVKRKWGGDAKLTSTLIKLDLEGIQTVCPAIDFPEEPDLSLEIEKERRRSVAESTTTKKLDRKVSVEYKTDHSERPSFEKQTSVHSVTKDSEEDNSNIIAFNRKISIVDDTASKLKPPPSPAKNPVSNILFITNLVRPFTVKQLKELLERTGKIQEEGFWTDRIKSKCYVQYETQEEAEATRNALHGVQWPIGNGKKLIIDYATEEDMQNAKNPPLPPPAAAPVPEPKVAVKENLEPVENKSRPEEKIVKELEKKKPEGPVREWDIGKKDVRRERSRSKERSRKHRRTPTPSEDFISRKQRKTEESVPQKLMDDLFLKTKATPSIYWQPLSPEEISMKQQQRLIRMEEHKRRMEENSRMKSRDVGRGAFRRRYD